jgi:DNA mismatch endonuclease, patch repair protein
MDILSRSERSKRMALIRSRDTKPEWIVRRLVHAMGYRFRLHVRSLPGCPDLVFRSRAKVIFVHGCFWHMHKNCCRPPKSRLRYWKPKLERNAQRDKRVRRELHRSGWRSLVIWECETDGGDELKRRIRRFLDVD